MRVPSSRTVPRLRMRPRGPGAGAALAGAAAPRSGSRIPVGPRPRLSSGETMIFLKAFRRTGAGAGRPPKREKRSAGTTHPLSEPARTGCGARRPLAGCQSPLRVPEPPLRVPAAAAAGAAVAAAGFAAPSAGTREARILLASPMRERGEARILLASPMRERGEARILLAVPRCRNAGRRCRPSRFRGPAFDRSLRRRHGPPLRRPDQDTLAASAAARQLSLSARTACLYLQAIPPA